MAIAATPSERVTVMMPAKLVAGIDRYERNRYERNRSRFIGEAVRHEQKRRQRQELQRSLEDPHPDSIATASLGLQSWAESLPIGDTDLLDPAAGVAVRWRPGQGWQEPGA
jgi:Arc/MetJ-type ribon-helix-helix transcriptional regulator